MSYSGNSYRCQTDRTGQSCPAPAGVYAEAADEALTRTWVAALTTAEPGSDLLEAVKDRWIAKHDPEALARRKTIVDEIDETRAAMESADDDLYVTRRLDRDRHARIVERLENRLRGLRRDLAAHPLPEADISPLLDPVLVREAWAEATVATRRDLLRLALVEVRVTQGRRGERFDPRTRLRFRWADDADREEGAAG